MNTLTVSDKNEKNVWEKNEADFNSLFWKTVIVYMWSDTTATLSVFDKNIPRHINVSDWMDDVLRFYSHADCNKNYFDLSN